MEETTFDLTTDQFEADYEKVHQKFARITGTAPIIFKKKDEDGLYIGTAKFIFDTNGVVISNIVSWGYTDCRKLGDDENPDELIQ